MNLYTPYPSSAITETATETSGFHMALNRTINAAMIAKVPSVLVFISFSFVTLMEDVWISSIRVCSELIYDLLAYSVTFQTGSRRSNRTMIPPSTKLGMPIPKEKSMLVGITMTIMK